MKEYAKLGISSDQHLMHPRASVDRIIHALKTAFPDSDKTAELDMLAYTGDFWDHEVSRSHPENPKVDDYIGWRLNQAKKHNYAVRVLKGTESHDRDQCKIWASIHQAIDPSIDFRYVDKMEIEHHPVMGSILYIPDEWKPTTDEIWADVCALLEQHNLTQVDWVFMHGAFDYLIPDHLLTRIQHHKSYRYQAICRKFVVCGHIHLPGQNGNILSPGSIERLNHNEEGPKGTLRIHCSPHGDEVIFQENKTARLALTWDYSGEVDEETIMNEIMERVLDIPNIDQLTDTGIRLTTAKGSFIHRNIKNLMVRFPEITWTTKDPKEKKTTVATIARRVDDGLVWANEGNISVNGAKESLLAKYDTVPDTLQLKIDDLFKETQDVGKS